MQYVLVVVGGLIVGFIFGELGGAIYGFGVVIGALTTEIKKHVSQANRYSGFGVSHHSDGGGVA